MANSTPMVDLESRLNSLRVNRLRRLDFPTPESPIRTTGHRGSQYGDVATAVVQLDERWLPLKRNYDMSQSAHRGSKQWMVGEFNDTATCGDERGRRVRGLTSYSSFAILLKSYIRCAMWTYGLSREVEDSCDAVPKRSRLGETMNESGAAQGDAGRLDPGRPGLERSSAKMGMPGMRYNLACPSFCGEASRSTCCDFYPGYLQASDLQDKVLIFLVGDGS